jgi:hypothetical protein
MVSLYTFMRLLDNHKTEDNKIKLIELIDEIMSLNTETLYVSGEKIGEIQAENSRCLLQRYFGEYPNVIKSNL